MDDSRVTRRRLLASGLALSAGLTGCQRPAQSNRASSGESTDGQSPAQTRTEGTATDTAVGDLALTGQRVVGGLQSPVGVEMVEPGVGFVVDQAGQLRRLDGDGLVDEPSLDVRGRLASDSGREMGLLGLALHPQFAENGRAFVRYSGAPHADTPDGFSHTFVLSEFQASPDRTTFDPDSERVLLTIPQPQANHNAGSVVFGPDGYLYVGVGDGGAGGDQGQGHVDDWYSAVGGGNGQDVTENRLGSVLRIDVDGGSGDGASGDGGDNDGGSGNDGSGGRAYGVPEDNPLVGRDGLDEHYAWGFRNPWRLSFGPDGRLFVADVGQSGWEEINVVERGGNYGWNVREGPDCFQTSDCPTATDEGDSLLDPIVAYPHSGGEVSGISVIGGYIYEGEALPALGGRYVFSDFRVNGRLFVATEGSDGEWSTTAVPVDGIGPLVTSFGRDADGELLVCTTNSSGTNGGVYRLQAA